MQVKKQIIDKYLWRAPHKLSYWDNYKLMLCKDSHQYNIYLVFYKDML